MANCQACGQRFPILTVWDVKHPNPLGNGYLCKKCFEPYHLVLEKYTTNLIKVDTDPKAAVWVAVCYLLTARRINLIRTVTATISGFFETKSSWEVCRQSAIELATKAMSMLPFDSEGRVFVKGLLAKVEELKESPPREIPLRLHASVWGDTILDIEYDAVMRSGVQIDELNKLVASLPGHQWLFTPKPSKDKNIDHD